MPKLQWLLTLPACWDFAPFLSSQPYLDSASLMFRNKFTTARPSWRLLLCPASSLLLVHYPAPSERHLVVRMHRGGVRVAEWPHPNFAACCYLGADQHWFVLFRLINLFYLFIYFWLCWVFVSVQGLSPVAASGGHSSSRCAGLLLPWPLPLRSAGSRRTGSVVVVHGPSRSAACGILPDQGSNPCPLHRQADPQPLRHQGNPLFCFFVFFF